jgi:hypothetical protein
MAATRPSTGSGLDDAAGAPHLVGEAAGLAKRPV